jgi:hypothetical protein
MNTDDRIPFRIFFVSSFFLVSSYNATYAFGKLVSSSAIQRSLSSSLKLTSMSIKIARLVRLFWYVSFWEHTCWY